ncbi:MAG: Ger(x)C family spore germination protein [Clostridia bacterium]|nr:Ger(x)C family spore germination protein [Clostridia bacterium]
MKKTIAAILSVFLCLSLCGCWNRREIGKIAIVMGFAVDKGEKEDEIEITAQIANTRTISSASEGKDGGAKPKPYLNLSSTGDYVFPSIRSSVSKSGSKLYMAHNYVVLFGRETAEEGLGNYMDFFLRDHELRLDMHLLVAREKGADVLDVNAGFQSIPSLHIHDLIQAQKQLSTGMTVTVFDYMNKLAAGRGAPLIPLIEISKSGGEDVLHMSGTAVFSGDKMIGALSERETRGLLWATDEVEQAVLMVPLGEERIGIEVLRAKGGMKAELGEGGNVTMVISAEAEGALGSERGKENYTTPEGIDRLLNAFAKEIESEIRACLAKGRTLSADVFGFSDVLYRYHPKKWESMQNTAFYDLPVRIEVKTKIDSSGRIGRPVK